MSDSERRQLGEKLAAIERALMDGPRGTLPEDWGEEDEPSELPAGEVLVVCADHWMWLVEYRPAHIVGYGCDCEPGIGAPYLLAWQEGEYFLVRELSDEESTALQAACLKAQAEEDAPPVTSPTKATNSETQPRLWKE